MQDFFLSYGGTIICIAIVGYVAAYVGYKGGHRRGFDAGRTFMIQVRARAEVMSAAIVKPPAPPRTVDPWRMTPEETFNLAVNPETAKVDEGGQFIPETPALGDRRIVEIVALDPPLYRLDQYDENDNRFARWSALPVGRAANGLFETRFAAAKAMMGSKTLSYSRVSVAAAEAPDTGAADFPDETADRPEIWCERHCGAMWAVFDRGVIASGPLTQKEAEAEVRRLTKEREEKKIGHWVRQNVLGDGKWYVFYGTMAGEVQGVSVANVSTAKAGPFTTQEDAQAEAAVLDGKALR